MTKIRDARWFVLKRIWVSFAMGDVGIFYGHLVYFRALEIFYCHLVYFVVIWYIFPRFGMLYQEKSGNPNITKPFKGMLYKIGS
jgi:hypothetical protein